MEKGFLLCCDHHALTYPLGRCNPPPIAPSLPELGCTQAKLFWSCLCVFVIFVKINKMDLRRTVRRRGRQGGAGGKEKLGKKAGMVVDEAGCRAGCRAPGGDAGPALALQDRSRSILPPSLPPRFLPLLPGAGPASGARLMAGDGLCLRHGWVWWRIARGRW